MKKILFLFYFSIQFALCLKITIKIKNLQRVSFYRELKIECLPNITYQFQKNKNKLIFSINFRTFELTRFIFNFETLKRRFGETFYLPPHLFNYVYHLNNT